MGDLIIDMIIELNETRLVFPKFQDNCVVYWKTKMRIYCLVTYIFFFSAKTVKLNIVSNTEYNVSKVDFLFYV